MSFLQINNANPSEKRPFRLSDIQDIWNGIKSLFKAVSGQQFRIISGFELVSGKYTSGTVWYNGELYEYDSNAYPITPSTTRVGFERIAQDNRVLEGGNTQPFSYKYVCGGDSLSASTTFSYFVRDIEKYKSYLGNGSVTTEKLADKSVSYDKLALDVRSGVSLGSFLSVTSDSFSLIDALSEDGVKSIGIYDEAPREITMSTQLGTVSNSKKYPAIVFLQVRSLATEPIKLYIGSTDSEFEIPARIGNNIPSYANLTLVKQGISYICFGVHYSVAH